MANAEEEVKRAAWAVVPWTNVESGVARMLEQLVL
jgi:hydroxymethylpyrimidine pyrophosphatase-like HAD family hydrolase